MKVQKIKCFFGIHKWESYVDNFNGEMGTTATIAWKDCKECGKSKMSFIYGTDK